MKPEETRRDPKSWYGRIKSGELTVCPVLGCGGSFQHDDMVTWYECVKCGWNDEFQDLCDMGHDAPKPGWPVTVRVCVVCGAKSDGTTLPSVELYRCLEHPQGHNICTLTVRETYRDACHWERVTPCSGEFKLCPVKTRGKR